MVSLDWAAGFFDGEGYVGCTKRTQKTGVRYRPEYCYLIASIGQVDIRPLAAFHAAVGGIGTLRGPYNHKPKPGGKHRPIYLWRASGGDVVAVFNLLSGRLILKQEQFDGAYKSWTEYQQTITKGKRNDLPCVPLAVTSGY